MWELDYKESLASKNWCFWTVVQENILESPLDCKEIQPVNPKGNQSWIFTGGLMLKLKLQYFDHLMWRADSLEMTLMLGKTEERRRRGRQRMKWLDGFRDSMDVSYEVVGWLHRLNGHEFDWTPGVGAGQGGLVCCSPWGHKDLDTTERLNWTELVFWSSLIYMS